MWVDITRRVGSYGGIRMQMSLLVEDGSVLDARAVFCVVIDRHPFMRSLDARSDVDEILKPHVLSIAQERGWDVGIRWERG